MNSINIVYNPDSALAYYIKTCGKLNEIMKSLGGDDVPEYSELYSEMQRICQNYKTLFLKKYYNFFHSDLFYIMVALIDEILINSNWSGNKAWTENSMEKKFFSSNNSGTIIITNIDNIISNNTADLELIFSYLILLGYGFKGDARSNEENEERYKNLVQLIGVKPDKNRFFANANEVINLSKNNYNIRNSSKNKIFYWIVPIFLVIYFIVWIVCIARTQWIMSGI